MAEININAVPFIFDTYPDLGICHGSLESIYLGPTLIGSEYVGSFNVPVYFDSVSGYWAADFSSVPGIYPDNQYSFLHPHFNLYTNINVIPSEATGIYVVYEGQNIEGIIDNVNYINRIVYFYFNYNPEWGGDLPEGYEPGEGVLNAYLSTFVDEPVWALRFEGNFDSDSNIIASELRINYKYHYGNRNIRIEGEAPLGDEWSLNEYTTGYFFTRPRLNSSVEYELTFNPMGLTIDITGIINEMVNHPGWYNGRVGHLFITTY